MDTSYLLAGAALAWFTGMSGLIVFIRSTMMSRKEHAEICVKKDAEQQAALDKLARQFDQVDVKQDSAERALVDVAKNVAVMVERMDWIKDSMIKSPVKASAKRVR